MSQFTRLQYLPGTGLGENGARLTASKEHIALSAEAAAEGMILLKNDHNVLPLQKNARVALFGKGTFDYVKGGGGSGDVTVSYIRNLYEGFKQLGNIRICEELADYYRKDVERQYAEGINPGMVTEPEVPTELLKQAKAFTDTAIISISRFSGEGWDRKSTFDQNKSQKVLMDNDMTTLSAKVFERGDFYLTKREEAMVAAVSAAFDKVIVVLNVGGMVDTGWFKNSDDISGVLLALQGGMEGGLAAARILAGLVNPSGKLVDTYASRLEDYPSTEGFHASNDFVEYTEDIFVGYRYFETIPGAKEKVNYPFGFGLSYTSFALSEPVLEKCDNEFKVCINVTNIGCTAGKEVVQVYANAPEGKLTKAARVLVAFKKTRLLEPGETQLLTMSFTTAQLASYDDCGKVAKSAYVLEKGDYTFYVGTSVRDTVKVNDIYHVVEDKIIEQLTEKMAPEQLTKRMLADGSYETVPTKEPNDFRQNLLKTMTYEESEGNAPAVEFQEGYKLWRSTKKVLKLSDYAEGKCTLDEFIAQFDDRQLACLLSGQPNTGVANTFGFGNFWEYGIPNAMTADGPAGLRIQPQCEVYTTAWPCATLLASSWNPELIEAVGAAGGAEVKENNIGFWLTPAINIHRSPLCGRNFEYYSEDPLIAGKLAAAMVRGIQSNRVGVSVKHFALNNKETNRKECDSRASERAIREIYLKAFEIIVKEADPWTIMSSYNVINGHRASENKELLEDILRGEWGFKGIVTTDWWTKGEHYKELLAGNDIKMGCGYPDRLMEAMKLGAITREDLERSVKRLLNVLIRFD